MRTRWIVAVAAAGALALPGAGAAQDGAGTTGAQVLQFPAGARAAALSGAHLGVIGDAEQLFYNPAGLVQVGTAAGLSVQSHVEGMLIGSLVGAHRIGRVSLGAGLVFMSSGDIAVIEPDPDFGGQRGRETGETARGTETGARLGAAMSFLDDRLLVGAALGFISADIAGFTRNAPFADLGVQYLFERLTVGAALQHLGGDVSGDGDPAPLPAQARIGAGYAVLEGNGRTLAVAADFIARLEEGTRAVATGLEGGILPTPDRRIGAVARLGVRLESDDALGRVFLGAGVTVDRIAVDYAFQDMEGFGAAHRFGVRWRADAP